MNLTDIEWKKSDTEEYILFKSIYTNFKERQNKSLLLWGNTEPK